MKLIRKAYLIEDAMLNKMEILKKDLTLTTATNVIRTAINLLWKDTYKYGTDPLLNVSNSSTVEDVAKRKVLLDVAKKKVAQDLKDAPKINRCLNDLCGEIVINPDGSKMCKWENHNMTNSYEQIIPLNQCGEYLISNLFQPSKEAVFKARPDLAKKFNENTK